MVLSQNLDRLSVYAPMIKAAIMRRGFILTSLTGVTSGTIRLATTGTFASQNVLRILEIVLPNVTLARLSDHSLIIGVRRVVLCILLPTLSDHWFDEIHVFFITK